MIPVVVDDLFPTYNKAGKYLRDRIATHLGGKVQVKFEGELAWALKMRVFRDKEKEIMKLSQESFTWEFLARHGLMNIKTAPTPIEANQELPDAKDVSDEEYEEYKNYPVRELIRGFMWLSRVTRPDIAVATHMAARVQHRPSKTLWRWLVHIAGYLRGTAHWGLVFRRPENLSSTALLEMWVDVSFGPQVGKEKGKSRYGYLVKFLSGTTAWCTKMSKRVFDSSTEAECNGVNEIRKENVWQRDLQTCLGLFKPETTVVWEDNTAAIALAGAGSLQPL